MINTLEYITKKFETHPEGPALSIPNFGRDEMAGLFAELGFKRGVELGVEAGLYSEVLCKTIPGLQLDCVDAWKAYKGYREYVSQEKIDTFYAAAQERLGAYSVKLVRKFSMDAVKDYADGSLDFVFIDGNHTKPYVFADITEWSKKVRSGGIVSGHDFIARKGVSAHQVKEAVYEYTELNKITPWFILGRRERIEGEIRDKSRTWMFVKQ